MNTVGKRDFEEEMEVKFLKLSGFLRDIVNMADFNLSLKSMISFLQYRILIISFWNFPLGYGRLKLFNSGGKNTLK